MITLSVTENQKNEDNLFYVQSTSCDLLSQAGCVARIKSAQERSSLTVSCPEELIGVIRAEIVDKIAEIITIKYKTEFLRENLKVGGLSAVEKDILYASLIAADLDDDKKYTISKINSFNEIAIDGVFNFCLRPLRKKWLDVCECVPNCFLNSQLKEFIYYLIENKRKTVYIDQGKVYDSHYRRLNRSSLLGGEKAKITREVLLSNCGSIDINGKIPKEDEFYLKEYYYDKIFFSGNYLN